MSSDPRQVGGSPRSTLTAQQKADVILRMLQGEGIDKLAKSTGCTKRELREWRSVFVAGGTAALALDQPLSDPVPVLQATTAPPMPRPAVANPYMSIAYARTLEGSAAELLYVPAWHTHVLVRPHPIEAPKASRRPAQGIRPYAALNPDCDLAGGLEFLRGAGIASITLLTDPLWCPASSALEATFTLCHPFKQSFVADRESGPDKIRKRHRNRANQGRRTCTVRVVELTSEIDRWCELYEHHANDQVLEVPFQRSHFERLALMPELVTFAVVREELIVAMTLWLRFGDCVYFHDGASDPQGFELGAMHLGYVEALRHFSDARAINFGGGSGFRDDPDDGLAEFKRGFSNATRPSYLCSAVF